MKIYKIIICIILTAASLCFSGCESSETPVSNDASSSGYESSVPKAPPLVSRGSKSHIPPEIQEKMKGISMPDNDDITFDDLSYLTIPHYNFKGDITNGHMVVNAEIADEVLNIFEELYNIKFPIERMELIDDFVPYIDETFNSLDRASMSRNNTSSFCYRVVAGTDTMSYHAYGKAIDINPKTNPYCVLSSGYVSPANAYQYADRNQDIPGMIKQGDEVYNIFKKYGWEWGGDWYNTKDYQHFQKTN